MTPIGDLAAAIRLTRPRQWPILTCQLAVGVVLTATRPGAANSPSGLAAPVLAAAWLAWVALLNGGTLAYNSAFDRDTGPVAYLRRPPQPPAWLAAAALGGMAAGAVLGWLVVGAGFGSVTASCLVFSVLYSHPAVRLKGRPGFDLLTNMVGYGAGTTAAGLLAGAAARSGIVTPGHWWFCAGFGLLFGSFYPLTQIYQLQEDRERGDRTLATALGHRRAVELALLLGALAVPPFWLGMTSQGPRRLAVLPALALASWLAHLAWCRWRPGASVEAQERAMYRALGLWAVVDVTVVAAWLA